MSCYMVDRATIVYLVLGAVRLEALANYRNTPDVSVWHGGRQRIVKPVELGNALWSENSKSVFARYPDCTLDDAPGPVGELYTCDESDFGFRVQMLVAARLDPVQYLKALKCYAYQSCEHDEWENSLAHAFVDHAQNMAISALHGYDAAAWGAPKWMETAVSARIVAE